MTTGPGGGSGTGPGGGGGTGPGRDLTADALLAEIDQLLTESPLPSLAEILRDAGRALAEALATLDLDVDPATEPTDLAWPVVSDHIRVHQVLIADARLSIQQALYKLARAGDLPTPARQSDQPSAAVGLSAIATAGGPVTTPYWHDFVLPRDIRQP